MKKIFLFCIALGAFSAIQAQEMLTLSQCLQMAVDNNLSLQKSRNEIARVSILSVKIRLSCSHKLMR